MTPLLTAEDLEARLPPNTLPLDAEGNRDDSRITLALRESTGVIVAHLPWLLDSGTGDIAFPLPPRFADALIGICADTALYRLTDRVSSHEDDRDRYAANMRLLDKIDREYQGGLSGPDYQGAEIVDEAADGSLEDGRYWKKGRPR